MWLPLLFINVWNSPTRVQCISFRTLGISHWYHVGPFLWITFRLPLFNPSLPRGISCIMLIAGIRLGAYCLMLCLRRLAYVRNNKLHPLLLQRGRTSLLLPSSLPLLFILLHLLVLLLSLWWCPLFLLLCLPQEKKRCLCCRSQSLEFLTFLFFPRFPIPPCMGGGIIFMGFLLHLGLCGLFLFFYLFLRRDMGRGLVPRCLILFMLLSLLIFLLLLRSLPFHRK